MLRMLNCACPDSLGVGVPKRAGEGFLPTAKVVLRRATKPLTCREIVERAVAYGGLQSGGKTPHSTLYALLTRDIARNGTGSAFKKVGPGLFQLRRKD